MKRAVRGLDHVVVRCRDVEASLAWYCGELGLAALDVEAWRSGARPFPSVRIDAGTIIDLVPARDPSRLVDQRVEDSFEQLGGTKSGPVQ